MHYDIIDATGYAPDGGKHYFLTVDGTPVAYVKVYENVGNHPVTLCDIETRPEYRNQGYAKRLLKMVAERYGVERVHHDGEYTEDGQQYIAHLVHDEGHHHSTHHTVTIAPQTFVQDWDTMTRTYL